MSFEFDGLLIHSMDLEDAHLSAAHSTFCAKPSGDILFGKAAQLEKSPTTVSTSTEPDPKGAEYYKDTQTRDRFEEFIESFEPDPLFEALIYPESFSHVDDTLVAPFSHLPETNHPTSIITQDECSATKTLD